MVERTENSDKSHAGMSSGMTLLFAVAGAAAVGNLYWAQPLLTTIASDLRVSVGESGALITVTQFGYAFGILLLVPLGDSVNRRRLVPAMMSLSVIALLISTFASTYWALLCGLSLVGLTSISGQLLLPLAGDLAKREQRGHVIGTIVSGLLIGIMLSRLVSGLVADALGWRAVYLTAAVVNIVFALCLAKCLPDDRPRAGMPYGKLLVSIASAMQDSRAVQVTLFLGACSFAVFTMFWTGLTFFLSSPPFGYTATQIGLFNLVGLAGAVAARRAGRLHDRAWSTEGTGCALALAVIALAMMAAARASIVLILLATLLINVAIQAVSVLNQTRLLTIRPELRSRLNTAFVVCNFIAGAAGSALAGALWQAGGWLFITAGQAVIIMTALVFWTISRRTLKAAEAISALPR